MPSKGSDAWRKHAAPYLKKALQQASKSWKPKAKRANMTKVKRLRTQREKINREIKRELNK